MAHHSRDFGLSERDLGSARQTKTLRRVPRPVLRLRVRTYGKFTS